ncbi:Piso0_000168 [Millerozyma farinosa CBS 7064]|uniref:Non-structural maintenance of chromosomes element 4 n=1 Tax=Pichia sorbitophila (strain ATCC MYA-4447 / BCRC 22081 / CBS 7064 / NBRC 10061 / NRRL Y-12695) TaxID=559304 RepID=G8YUP9_PICSO|nr:Piso0_000168 [Millerozyma farinosa CBS 7064]
MSSSDTDGSDDSSSSAGATNNNGNGQIKESQHERSNALILRYEQLKQKMHSMDSEAHKGQAMESILNHIKELDEIFNLVQKDRNRDTIVQLKDAEAFMDTSKFAATNARNLKLDNLGISISKDEFLSQTKRYMEQQSSSVSNEGGDDEFHSLDWVRLGTLYETVSLKPVTNEFLLGALETEKKQRAPRARNIDDTKHATSTTANLLAASDISNNNEKSTADMVKDVFQAFLSKRDTHDNKEGINFFKFFINPHSFPQSIENLFFTSFLIKDSKLKIYKGADGIPYVSLIDSRDMNAEGGLPNNSFSQHHIASLDYKTWQELIKKFNITESFLGNRHYNEED